MRWPFGPPHLTLQNQKEKKRRKRKPKKTKKWASRGGGGVPNLPFLKSGPKKHYKNWGFSKPKKQKHLTVTKGPFLDKKQDQKFQLSICAFFFQTTKHKKLLKPLVCSVLANIKMSNIKHKNRKLHPIFEKKTLFLENWQIIGHKKTQNNNWAWPKFTWNHYKNRLKAEKQTWADNDTTLDQQIKTWKGQTWTR